MTANQLLTQEALHRDIFNSRWINTKDVKVFLMYFGAILQLGMDEGLLDEARRNAIASAITSAIELKTNGDDDDEEYDVNYVQIRNYMYILNSYLQSKSNWEAWLELIKIESRSDAISLMKDAQNWLTRKLNSRMAFLTAIRSNVENLRLSNVTNAYNLLVANMKDFMTCTSETTKFDLKTYHYGIFGIGTYTLMTDETQDADNFCMKFCDVIYNFCMEVSIMSKINTSDLVASKEKESDAYYKEEFKEVEAINDGYEAKLAKLKADFEKKIDNCYDQIDAERRYAETKLELEQEWERELDKLEKRQAEAEEFQIEILGGEYSLYDLIKEYAIFSLAKNGVIQYPSTILERSALLMSIEKKLAITEFISINRKVLKDEQVDFLNKIAGN